jgi:hypothetical protein
LNPHSSSLTSSTKKQHNIAKTKRFYSNSLLSKLSTSISKYFKRREPFEIPKELFVAEQKYLVSSSYDEWLADIEMRASDSSLS